MGKKTVKILVSVFTLNFLWEISQAFLYVPHFSGAADFIAVHLRASLGDLVLTALILLADSFLIGRIFSGKHSDWRRSGAVVLVGALVGITVEKYALASGRWQYGELMPVIPILRVGLTPILQMALIPLLAMYLNSWPRSRKSH
ncbi:MAG: hypothetical protein WC120_02085 [Parcubacteria group bacterium]